MSEYHPNLDGPAEPIGLAMTAKERREQSELCSSALLGVEACGLHQRTPYGMTNVSMTQLSIARYYGGCIYQGDHYTYLDNTDELIRDDVLKWKRKQKRAHKTPNEKAEP